MALSDYFTDDELISQLKMYFELEEMWNIVNIMRIISF